VLLVIIYSHAPFMLTRNYFYTYVMLILSISILFYIMWSLIYLKLKCLFYYFIHISWSQCRNNDTWVTALITMAPCGILNMHCYNFVTRIHYMGLVLRKLGLMHVRKVSSNISLCSLDRLIRDDTLRFFGIFSFKEVPSYRKSSFGGKCRPWLACADCTG